MKHEMGKVVEIFGIIFMIFMVIASISLIFIMRDFSQEMELEFKDRLIRSHIEANDKYELVDIIDSKSNPNHAYIYKSNFESIDETVKDLIKSVPMKVQKTTDDGIEETNSIGLITEIEYAYVYEKDGKIYVQNADDLFLDNDGGYAYHEDQNESYLKAYKQEFINPDYDEFIKQEKIKYETEVKNNPEW